jgi:hypothetical protein
VLVIAGSLFASVRGLILLNILNRLAEIVLSSSQCLDTIVAQLGVSYDLSAVVVDVCIHISSNSIASRLVSAVDAIMLVLILKKTSNNLVQ